MDLPEESPKDAPRPRPDPARLRASDADRDRVADQLREALAEGRLSPEEHAERIDAVYAAKTYAELAPIVEDLPTTGRPEQPAPSMDVADGGAAAALPTPVRHAANIVAIFSGADRKGRWLVEAHTSVVSIFSGVELDLRQAVLSQREVTINITCIFGGVEIKVPPGVRVINSTAAVFGGVALPGDEEPAPDAPVIRLTGVALFGGVEVKRRPAEVGATGDLRARQREIQREYHERRRDAHRELRQRHRELRDLRRAERHQRRRGG